MGGRGANKTEKSLIEAYFKPILNLNGAFGFAEFSFEIYLLPKKKEKAATSDRLALNLSSSLREKKTLSPSNVSKDPPLRP